MVLELRTEEEILGCDGFTRYRDRLSPFGAAADEADVVRRP